MKKAYSLIPSLNKRKKIIRHLLDLRKIRHYCDIAPILIYPPFFWMTKIFSKFEKIVKEFC